MTEILRLAGTLAGAVALTLSVTAPVRAEPPGSVAATGLRTDDMSSPPGIDDAAPHAELAAVLPRPRRRFERLRGHWTFTAQEAA
jgi:hypothetical protein